jgi:hypothetical protein
MIIGVLLIFLLCTALISATVVCSMWLDSIFGRPTHQTSLKVFRSTTIEALPQHAEKPLRTFNPSLATIGENTLYSFRISNFSWCTSSILHNAQQMRGKQIKSFVVLTTSDLSDAVFLVAPDVSLEHCEARGFEDARIIVGPDSSQVMLIVNARTRDAGNLKSMVLTCLPEMHLVTLQTRELAAAFQLTAKPKTLTVRANQIVKLQFLNNKIQMEKNWMPFLWGAELMFIYSVNPHVILKCDRKTGVCTKVAETSNSRVNPKLRGGSQARFYKGQFFAVAHTQVTKWAYLTTIYSFQATPPFRVTGITPSFVIDDVKLEAKSSIQFVSGFDIVNDEAVIAYGQDDCHPKIFRLSMVALLAALEQV